MRSGQRSDSRGLARTLGWALLTAAMAALVGSSLGPVVPLTRMLVLTAVLGGMLVALGSGLLPVSDSHLQLLSAHRSLRAGHARDLHHRKGSLTPTVQMSVAWVLVAAVVAGVSGFLSGISYWVGVGGFSLVLLSVAYVQVHQGKVRAATLAVLALTLAIATIPNLSVALGAAAVAALVLRFAVRHGARSHLTVEALPGLFLLAVLAKQVFGGVDLALQPWVALFGLLGWLLATQPFQVPHRDPHTRQEAMAVICTAGALSYLVLLSGFQSIATQGLAEAALGAVSLVSGQIAFGRGRRRSYAKYLWIPGLVAFLYGLTLLVNPIVAPVTWLLAAVCLATVGFIVESVSLRTVGVVVLLGAASLVFRVAPDVRQNVSWQAEAVWLSLAIALFSGVLAHWFVLLKAGRVRAIAHLLAAQALVALAALMGAYALASTNVLVLGLTGVVAAGIYLFAEGHRYLWPNVRIAGAILGSLGFLASAALAGTGDRGALAVASASLGLVAVAFAWRQLRRSITPTTP